MALRSSNRTRLRIVSAFVACASVACATAVQAVLTESEQLLLCQKLTQYQPTEVSVSMLNGLIPWHQLAAFEGHNLSQFQHESLRFDFPAELTVVDINYDGILDFAYGVDVVGQLWRFRLPGSRWSFAAGMGAATRLAELGGSVHNTSEALVRGVSSSVAVAVHKDFASGQKAMLIAVGSGLSQFPASVTGQDGLFIFWDSAPWGGEDVEVSLSAETPHPDVLLWHKATKLEITAKPRLFINWLPGIGEKVFSTPLVVKGMVYFHSYLPDLESNTCPPLPGETRLYIFDASQSEPVLNLANSAKLPYVLSYEAGIPAAAAWQAIDWRWQGLSGQIILRLDTAAVPGPILPRLIERLAWRRLSPLNSPD